MRYLFRELLFIILGYFVILVEDFPPENPAEQLTCNIRDETVYQAKGQIDKIEKMKKEMGKAVVSTCVVGEELTIETDNGVAMKMKL